MAQKKLFSRRAQTPARAEDLDERMKLNRGTGVSFAEDTGSKPGFILPYGRTMRDPNQAGSAPTYQQRQTQLPTPEPSPSPEPIFAPEVMGASTSDVSSLTGFFDQFNKSLYNPSSVGSPTTEFLEKLYQTTGQTYGIASMADGRIMLNDRTIVDGMTTPVPIASQADGTVRMSDGTFRRLNPNIAAQLTGISGLQQGIFGRNQTITQQFGNYNPAIEPGSGYNLGTDFRTRDLAQRAIFFPTEAEVVDVKYDDGTRFGDRSGHQGYGNSVLLRLSTGEMLRLSHLSELGQLTPGQRISAGTFVGTPGATGNTTGEHLDLEYYNAQGQIDNPENFSGFTNPMQLLPATTTAQAPQSNAPMASMASMQPQMSQAPQAQPTPSPLAAVRQAAQPQSPQRQQVGSGINAVGQAAAQVGIGKNLGNSPEGFLGVGELAAGNIPAAGREISATIERLNPTPRIDTGASEFARGDFEGAKRNFEDTKNRIMARLSEVPTQVANTIVPQAYASDGTPSQPQSSLASNIEGAGKSVGKYIEEKTKPLADAAQTALQAAGSGVDQLKRFFTQAAPGVTTRPSPSDISGERMVGDSPRGSNLLGVTQTPQQAQARQANDIRDPFFRSGQFTNFGAFLRPGAVETGALTIDAFTPEFFQDQENVSGVFGGTSLAPQAQAKYDAYGEEQRRKEEERIRQQTVTIDDYLRQGKSLNEWYAETGRQSLLDELNANKRDPMEEARRISQSNATVNQAVSQGAARTPTGNMTPNYTPANANMTDARTGLAVRGGATYQARPQQNYTPANANMSTNRGAVYAPYTPPQQQSVFQRAASSISKLFRR